MARKIEVQYIVSDDVPTPTKRRDFSVIRTLEVGQSVAFPLSDRNALAQAAPREKKNNKKFTTHKEGNEVRIWRTK